MKKRGRGRERAGERECEGQEDKEGRRQWRYAIKTILALSLPPSPALPLFLPTRQPQPLQRVGRRIAGCGNIFLGLEAAHGFDCVLVVYAGQFAGVEASLLERLLNLERARPVYFEGLMPCRVSL